MKALYFFSPNKPRVKYWPFQSYLKYQKELKNKKTDKIKFLFDVDLDKNHCNDQYDGLAKHVPKDFLNFVKEGQASKNMIDYTGMNLPGIEFPQMYFKVKGCLTPPHQETLSFLSYNLNYKHMVFRK